MAELAHQQIFQARLKRISAGGKNTMSQVYIGDSATDLRRVAAKTGQKRGGWAARARFLNAVLIGAISMAIARLSLFHFVSDDGTYAEQIIGPVGVVLATTIGDFAIAGALGMLALSLKKMGVQKYLPAMMIGIFLIILGESKLLQANADIYAALYSPTYTQARLAALN